ncbi:hypothetical protein PF005_g11376 [Phytophthora fragariae]|uniref:Uncharacterized protein n=1 Tax=Phytophthora fragariae TaxID=53985 RepID=A0A6A3XY82_9STRA|nr:hypothetical protein PF005_g11376 [Phytophthora fragariae]
MEGRVRLAAHVPQLQEDLGALGVHAVHELLPDGLVLVRVERRGSVPPEALLRDASALRDEKAGTGALLVVHDVALQRHVRVRVRACASRGAVDDAVLEHEVLGQLQRREELVVGGDGKLDGGVAWASLGKLENERQLSCSAVGVELHG